MKIISLLNTTLERVLVCLNLQKVLKKLEKVQTSLISLIQRLSLRCKKLYLLNFSKARFFNLLNKGRGISSDSTLKLDKFPAVNKASFLIIKLSIRNHLVRDVLNFPSLKSLQIRTKYFF